MTHDELLELVRRAHRELSSSGVTLESDAIRQGLERAIVQLENPYPALIVLRKLCAASQAGKAMDRYTDPDVMELWATADRVLTMPFVPDTRHDVALTFESTVIDPGGWIQLRERYAPAPGDIVQVWGPRRS